MYPMLIKNWRGEIRHENVKDGVIPWLLMLQVTIDCYRSMCLLEGVEITV